MLDLLERCKSNNKKIHYVWFDTGLEYQATKDHIKYLEDKYNIEIDKCKAIKPIPLCVREYGVPFLNKYVSEMIQRLQQHEFQWEDKSYDILSEIYPNCITALKWWCNTNKDNGAFNISRNKYLKEFIVQNPPMFKISNKCCNYSKKNTSKQYNKQNDINLACVGIRRSEGGIRSVKYISCFSENSNKYDDFRPLFWYSDSDKYYYETNFEITHSKCYTEYGLKRTGCVGCPYGRNFEQELESVRKYEPKLYKACINIFGESYEYTKKYREFQKMMKEKEKEKQSDLDGQLKFDGLDD